ncbi:MAG: polysaccharide deacetylase family protein [bacterium]|nr:polysaccharide deacetylase family protein [bacterium]MCS7310216.1 polysaccharide deacetylase family protein [Armatimonadota bacterium]
MYHNVGGQGRSLNVPPQALARQCRLLHLLGFRAIPLRELIAPLQEHRLPPRTVVFTFDDALLGVYELARPLLRAYGWRATVFAVYHHLGGETEWASHLRHRVMSQEQLTALAREGWEVGAHTLTHPHLTRLPAEKAYQEIAGCRHELQRLLGEEVRSFCYPFGDLNEQVVQMVREAGYHVACTVRKGLVHPHSEPLLLPRVPIAYSDGALGLLYRLLRAWRHSR